LGCTHSNSSSKKNSSKIYLLNICFIFKGLLNAQTTTGPNSRPVANFDPEGNLIIYIIFKLFLFSLYLGVVFAVGIQSSLIKLYDIRHFDKVCKLTDRGSKSEE
jgi:hypothetical protein